MPREGGAGMKPTRLEFDLGRNHFDQPIRLVLAATTDGARRWELCQEQANQRDDRASIGGLTRDQLIAMAEIARETE